MTRPLLKNLGEIAERMGRSRRVMLGLDYDGTLTPIVDDPRQAMLSAETRDVLAALVARPNTAVAIISGRGLDDLYGLVGVAGITYAGNHGLDISGPGLRFVEGTSVRQQGALDELANLLRQRLEPIAGIILEHKGLTLTIHFRRVAAREEETVRRIAEAAMEETNYVFRMTLGHKVFEIRPRVDWHKGKALAFIRDRLAGGDTLVTYVGDDETDEDAFAELPGAITVKVGPPTDTSAAFYVDSPDDVRTFLAKIAAAPPSETRP